MTCAKNTSLSALRRILRALTLSLLVLPAWPAWAECVLYSQPNFSGETVVVEDNIAVPRFGRLWNDRISSIKTSAVCSAELYEHWDYGGRAGVVETFMTFGDAEFWNNRASALRCRCDQPRESGGLTVLDRDRADEPSPWTGQSNPPSPARRGAACIVFEQTGFEGPWRAFREGETNRDIGRPLVEEVNSARVARGCVVLFETGDLDGVWIGRDAEELREQTVRDATTIDCFCR